MFSFPCDCADGWCGGRTLELSVGAKHGIPGEPGSATAPALCLPPKNTIGRTGPDDFTADASGALSRGPGLVYGGAQILNPAGLADIPEKAFSLNILWDRMIGTGRLRGAVYPGRWCDVGRPEGIALAEDLIADV